MKYAAALLLLAVGSFGCSASSALFNGSGNKAPDQETVETYVCGGQVDQAERYLVARGVALADRMEQLARAKKACAAPAAPTSTPRVSANGTSGTPAIAPAPVMHCVVCGAALESVIWYGEEGPFCARHAAEREAQDAPKKGDRS